MVLGLRMSGMSNTNRLPLLHSSAARRLDAIDKTISFLAEEGANCLIKAIRGYSIT
jgi:hypothetical protein